MFQPQISILAGTQTIPSGGTYAMSPVQEGATGAEETLTVANAGLADLTLTGEPRAALSGTDASEFEVTVQPPVLVPHESSADFRVRFKPSAYGSGKTATLTIASNDSAHASYTVVLVADATQTPPGPEINVKCGTTDLPSGGTLAFGSIPRDTTSDVTITIENKGREALNLTGTPFVAISGADLAKFSVTAQPTSGTVAADGSASCTVRFNPAGGTGGFTATLSIPSDDADENPYTLTLTGTGLGPEINLKNGATDLPSGSTLAFGSIAWDATSDITVTIENQGGGTLNLTGSPAASISGTDADKFTVTAQPATAAVTYGTPTSVTVRFTPGGAGGSKTATLTIVSDDPDEGTYTLTLTGTGLGPDINLKSGTTDLASYSTVDFGSIAWDTTTDITLTVENLGAGTLHLTGSPTITGATAYFSVTAQPATTVAGFGSTSITIRFDPSGTDTTRVATLTILSDDTGESPYTLTLSGAGLGPEINVKDDTETSIASGGMLDCGDIVPSQLPGPPYTWSYNDIVKTFTIENTGPCTLTLTGSSPYITKTGADQSRVTIETPPANTIAAGSSTTFTVKLTRNTSVIGTYNAKLTIYNNDTSEGTYEINLTWERVEPDISLSATSIDFGTPNAPGAPVMKTLTITNDGNADLVIGYIHLQSGMQGFSISTSSPAPIAAGNNLDITITWGNGQEGTFTDTVLLEGVNDPDEGSPSVLSVSLTVDAQ